MKLDIIFVYKTENKILIIITNFHAFKDNDPMS